MPEQKRQLAAIMFTDIVGYTALMGENSQKAMELVHLSKEIQQPLVEKFNGKWLKEMGDGALIQFSTALDAVNCAIEIQEQARAKFDGKLRIGIHLGDITIEDEDVYGDGVNVASRLEAITDPGGIYISDAILKAIQGQSDIETKYLGEIPLKNVAYELRTYAIQGVGLPIPADVERKIPEVSESKKKYPLWAGIGAALVIVILAFFLYLKFFETKAFNKMDSDELSIAVLPFKIIGNDLEGQYFAEGVQREILNHLDRINDLHVKSGTSVEKFKDRNPTTDELVTVLKLSHYLEGSAQKDENRIRITVQLIDATTNDQMWAKNYDRNYENLLDTQSEIAKKVAEELRVKMSPEVASLIDRKPTDNPQTWDDYLQAMHFWRRFISLREPYDLENMVNFLKSSIHKDPKFALGYSNLALAYQQVPGDPQVIFDFIYPDSVLILCNMAIELDPLLSDPYVTRARYYSTLDTVAATRDYRQAIVNGPHLPRPYWRYGNFQHEQNWNIAAALKLYFLAVQNQPDSWTLGQMFSDIGFAYLEVADYQKAEYYMDKAMIYNPDNIVIMGLKGHLYKVTGNYEGVAKTAQRMMEIAPLNLGLWELAMYSILVKDYEESAKYFDQYYSAVTEIKLDANITNNHTYGYALLKTGQIKEANKSFEIAINAIRERVWDPTPDYEYAKIYSARGMADSAYYHLERAVAGPIHWGMSDFMENDPLFEDIKDELEFQGLVAIAREKVRLKREEVRRLEESGQIPVSLDQIELY